MDKWHLIGSLKVGRGREAYESVARIRKVAETRLATVAAGTAGKGVRIGFGREGSDGSRGGESREGARGGCYIERMQCSKVV